MLSTHFCGRLGAATMGLISWMTARAASTVSYYFSDMLVSLPELQELLVELNELLYIYIRLSVIRTPHFSGRVCDVYLFVHGFNNFFAGKKREQNAFLPVFFFATKFRGLARRRHVRVVVEEESDLNLCVRSLNERLRQLSFLDRYFQPRHFVHRQYSTSSQ